MTAPLTQDRADAIREAGARAAASAIKNALERQGSSPEVLALTIEGLFAGAVTLAWRNRVDGTSRKTVVKLFSRILAKALDAGTVHR